MSYSLEVVSCHPKFAGKLFRKHLYNGLETIGVWENEPFEIRFVNNSWEKIQVKLSIDGVDILTGEKASAQPSGKMWAVDPYKTLTVKAWAETNHGGSGFIFTNPENGVSSHIHQDSSNNGIIAAAVFKEGYVQPINWNLPIIKEYYYPFPYNWFPLYPAPYYPYPDYWYQGTICTTSISSNTNCAFTISGYTDSFILNNQGLSTKTLSINTLPSVGAREYLDQEIKQTTEFIKPILEKKLLVRYMWWDELKQEINKESSFKANNLGFPGDPDSQNFSLGNVPKIKQFYSSSIIPKEIHRLV